MRADDHLSGRKPKVGIMFRREQDPASLVPYARKVESMGFDQLWVVEDCFYSGGISQTAIALAATERITVGIGIAPAIARNPAMLAMEFATLANAFPGRFTGGIGHGVAEWMEQIGARPASWLRSIDEITSATRAILRGEHVSATGEYVRLDGVQLDRPPANTPDVLLGVRGEKSLRLAGRCADGVILAEGSAPGYIRWARERIAEGRRLAGRNDGYQTVVYANCVVDDDDPERAITRMRPIVAESIGDTVPVSFELASFAEELDGWLRDRGADSLTREMPAPWVQEVAIAGSVADAWSAMARYGAAGVDTVVLTSPDIDDIDVWLDRQLWAVHSR